MNGPPPCRVRSAGAVVILAIGAAVTVMMALVSAGALIAGVVAVAKSVVRALAT